METLSTLRLKVLRMLVSAGIVSLVLSIASLAWAFQASSSGDRLAFAALSLVGLMQCCRAIADFIEVR